MGLRKGRRRKRDDSISLRVWRSSRRIPCLILVADMRGLELILLLIVLLYGQEVYANLCLEDQRVVSKQCQTCPTSMANDAGDNPTGEDTSCQKCAIDYYVVSKECKKCPPGTENKAKDNVSGEDTECTQNLCSANEYVSHNECTPCPSHNINAANDDASGSDTVCGECAEGYYVISNVCTSCPPGMTNVAGDDESGSDTECDTTFCSVNEYVSSNVCTSCPPGTTNAVGNHDASKLSTECDANPGKKSYMIYVWSGIGIFGAVLVFFVYKRFKKRRNAFIETPSRRFMPTPLRLERENNVMEAWMTSGRSLAFG